jgi:hypothetical protein
MELVAALLAAVAAAIAAAKAMEHQQKDEDERRVKIPVRVDENSQERRNR